jgi:hypothetical protein
MKIVVNRCYGGFNLSPQAVEAIAKRKGESPRCASFIGKLDVRLFVGVEMEQTETQHGRHG